jgi:caffeoyl-CoA O-methyltransferase
MSFDVKEMGQWLDGLVPPRHEEMVRMEAYAAEHGFPIVGPASGQALFVLARLLGARSVFELGSGYGYSTAWFARAVQANGGGVVHHVVWDEKLSGMARAHLAAMGFPEAGSGAGTEIAYTVGEAVAALRAAPGPYDLVFNDVDKEAYPDTIDVVAAKLRPGGLFVTDNVVWSGKTWDASVDDERTEAIRRFVARMTADPAWETTVLPIRDGLLVARKVG